MLHQYYIFVFFTAVLLSCEKQKPAPPPTLSEYIVGDGEIREVIDLVNFGDFEYHDVGPIYYNFYRFKADNSYEYWINGNPGDPVPYSVSEQDSTLKLLNGTWKLVSFDETMIDFQANGRHGLTGRRIYKIE